MAFIMNSCSKSDSGLNESGSATMIFEGHTYRFSGIDKIDGQGFPQAYIHFGGSLQLFKDDGKETQVLMYFGTYEPTVVNTYSIQTCGCSRIDNVSYETTSGTLKITKIENGLYSGTFKVVLTSMGVNNHGKAYTAYGRFTDIIELASLFNNH